MNTYVVVAAIKLEEGAAAAAEAEAALPMAYVVVFQMHAEKKHIQERMQACETLLCVSQRKSSCRVYM